MAGSTNHRSGLALGLRSSGCATGFASAGAIVGLSGKSGSQDDELQAKGSQKSLAVPPGRVHFLSERCFGTKARNEREDPLLRLRVLRDLLLNRAPVLQLPHFLIREDPRQSAADFLASKRE